MFIVNNKIKTIIRDSIPKKHQVPLKYYYNKFKSYLEPEMKLLQYLVKNNDHVIDVGGNLGIYSYKFWKLGAQVEVYEPNPTCNNVLEEWAKNKPNINIHTVGLSDSENIKHLYIPIDEKGCEHNASASIENVGFSNYYEKLVNVKTLDSYEFENISFIKIDVEGHEYNVLAGAEKLISSSQPTLLVEIEQRHINRQINEVFQKILNLGYQGFFLDGTKIEKLEKFDILRHQKLDNCNNTRKIYINNFLFLHRDRLVSGKYDNLFDGHLSI